MPQTGDGGLWPTTDDDTPSTPAKDAETHELPVPDQQEQSEKQAQPKAGWFDTPDESPDKDKPAPAEPKRDEPHAKPKQQITQPMPWPIADLERQTPAWPSAENNLQTNQQSAATSFVPANRPAQEKPKEDSQPDAAQQDNAPASDDPEHGQPEPDSEEAEQPAAAQQEEKAPSAPQPSQPENDDPQEPATTDSSRIESEDASHDEARPEQSESDDRENAPPATTPQEGAPSAGEPAQSKSGSEDTPSGPGFGRPGEPEGGREVSPLDTPRQESASGFARADESESDDASSRASEQESVPTSGRPEQSEGGPDESSSGESRRRDASGFARPGGSESEEASSGGSGPGFAWLGQSEGGADESSSGESRQESAAGFARADESEGEDAPSGASHQGKGPGSGRPGEPGGGREESPSGAPRRGSPSSFAWPGQSEEDSSPSSAQRERGPGPARPDQSGTRHEEAATSFMRPVRPESGRRKDDSRQEDVAPSFIRPRTGKDPRQEEAATSFMRPVQPERGDAPTSFMRPVQPEPGNRESTRQDNPPSFRRPAQPEPGKTRQEPFRRPRQEEATSFIRRDRQDPPSLIRNTDSATVDLTRGKEWPPPEPPRAAPERVGPEPAEPEQQRKSRRPLLITAISIAAVIAVAAGVVFGVPGLSDKLGLTGEDPVAIDPPPAPISYSPSLHGPDAATAGPTRQGVEQALAGPMSVPALGNVNGVVIDPATGETLYEKNADGAITPASTGKILTAAAALLSLDPTEQLVTKVVEGDQPGEVIIVGGGDPTISSLEVGKESIYPGAAHLSELVDQVKGSGAQVQTVYIDQSRYAPPGLAPSWLPADIGLGYIAPIVPAMLDGDRQGDATENYSPRTTDPGRTLVDAFANRIGASAANEIEKKAPENAKVLGEIRSAPMTQLVDNMLNRSENTLADVLAHEVAIKAGEKPDFGGASKAMLDVLRQNGFNVDGVVLRDGSGMSEENKMTARLLAEVLAVAASPDGKDPRTAKLRPLLGGLPVAGGSGTLADRYTEADAVAGKGWVRAKTGSLTGINSLAGIVLDKDNRPLVFAFLTSGTVATSARPALDSVTAALRGCGCQ